MKNLFAFATLVFMSLGASCQAQSSNFWDGLKLGFKAGANYSNVYDSQGEQFKADGKAGFVAGGFAEIPLTEFVGIHPEILYSQKGFKASGQYLGAAYTFTRTTDNIDIPILLTVKPTTLFTLFGGPQFSYLVKQKDVFSSTLLSAEQQQDFSNDNYRKNLLSFTAGIGLNMGPVILDLRANYDLQNNNGDGTRTTPRYKNAWYQATLGIRIL